MKRISRHIVEKIAFGIIGLAAVITAIPIIIIIISIFFSGVEVITWSFLLEIPRDGMRAGGIWPAIIGTFYLVFGTGMISIPLGIASAIYLSEYATDNYLTRMIRLAIVNLAGIPSVVYGLFGLGLFVLFLICFHVPVNLHILSLRLGSYPKP